MKAPALWQVFLLCLLATLLIRVRSNMFTPASDHWNDPVDHWKYEYVAEHPLGSFHIQPTCWRIGIPLLTRILPFSTYRSFEVLNLLFYTVCGVLIYLWLQAIPLPRDEALLGVLMFYSMGAVVKLVLAGVETPDPGSYFFTLLALYAIYSGRDYLCAVALLFGVFTKETVMVVVPLHYTLKASRMWDLGRMKRSVLVALPAVGAFVAIRLAIPAWNDHAAYVRSLPYLYTQVSGGDVRADVWTLFHAVMREYRGVPTIDLIRVFTWGSLGIPFFLPLFAPRENRNLFLRWAPYWAPIVGSLFIALNPDRRVGSFFPVLIVAGLNGVRALAARLGVEVKEFLLVFLLQFLLLLLKKSVPIVPFDLAAAVFIVSLSWIVIRAKEKSRAVPAEYAHL